MDQSRLRRLLVSRFIATITIVAVIEYFVFLFINRVALPMAASFFAPNPDAVSELSLGRVLIAILLLLLVLLSKVVSFLFPTMKGTSEVFSSWASAQFVANNIVKDGDEVKILLMMILFLLLILIMAIIPYVIGAIAYSGMVLSKMRELEADIDRERRDAEKSRYLMISDIVHDLKTPMTTVSGYAQALNDGVVKKEDQSEYLSSIKSKTERMNEIVNLLFDYVKLDSEGFTLVKKRLDLAELLREICAGSYTDIEDAGDEIDINIPEEPFFIDADRLQLTRAITNLIVNAVKHNAKGTKIGVFLRDEYEDIRIYIADSGLRIDDSVADTLFSPFVMGDKSRNSGGGTGLGLSITKKICDLHGFKVKLVQRPDINRYSLGEQYNKVFVIIISK